MLRKLPLLLAIAFVLPPLSATALTINYVVSDLPDAVPGEDLYRYDYYLSDGAFAQDQGFSIYFDPSVYATLGDVSPNSTSEWDIILLQPDPEIPADGLFDSLALVELPSVAHGFLDFPRNRGHLDG